MKKSTLLIVIAALVAVLLVSSALVIMPGGVKDIIRQQAGMANTRPIAIMVENSFAARPQSGLYLADVVFEVVDEYGITRFVAVYASQDAGIVGPVRSSRMYYADIAKSFDPVYWFLWDLSPMLCLYSKPWHVHNECNDRWIRIEQYSRPAPVLER